MRAVAVLQARTSSSRLPGKVLLPIAGMPLAVLAALRAVNTGRDLVLATSDERSDDMLAHIALGYGLQVYRGSLRNTLRRVTEALAAYPANTLVFRLTADNVFPDGNLLDEMEERFLAQGSRYLSCGGPESGLPYGVSAELMYLDDLREASALTKDPHDQEHVTPPIIRKYGKNGFERYRELGKSHFRATIDSFDDYISVQQSFVGVSDPVSESYKSLILRLEKAEYQPREEVFADKLVLGTAQLGMSYGIANHAGKPAPDTGTALIKQAITNGVKYLDTARAYGDSEYLIGSTLGQGWQGRAQVITKLAPMDSCPATASPETVASYVEASVYHSCCALRVREIDVLLLHRAEYRTRWAGAAWTHLQTLSQRGVIGTLGVSVQSPDELLESLSDPAVGHIQLPFNLLDWRWDLAIPEIRRVKQSRKIVVHVRSALLQGLLTVNDRLLWAKAGVRNPDSIISWLEQAKKITRISTTADLCISYCIAQDWIDGVVVGMESPTQLMENLRFADISHFDRDLLLSVVSDRPVVGAEVLDPACWEQNDIEP